MGQTLEKVIVKNLFDVVNAEQNIIKESKIRSAEIEAIVDTGASNLCLPPKVIKKLGLHYSYSTPVKTANGTLELRIFDGATITIKGRKIQMQVMENINDDVPALIGYLILEAMDWVVDPKSREIIGNPKNDGKWFVDMY